MVDAASRALEDAGGGRLTVGRTPLRVDPAGVTPPDAEVVRFLEGESGNGSMAIPFGTELPELIHLGAEACVFGPGDIRVAHRTGEFVPLPELHQAAEIYGRAIARFCA
jgi:acetylornithine deacetylase